MKFLHKSKLACMLAAFSVLFLCTDLSSQIKLNESFGSEVFPPQGWSVFSVSGTGTTWERSDKYCRSAEGCASSGFDTTSGKSFLVTKRITPSPGDSLVFYLRQTFYRTYSDTFKVMVSVTDSLPGSMNAVLLNLADGQGYPSYQHYGRYSVSLNQFAGQTIWISFYHANINGDILRLDEITVGRQLQNDIAVNQISSPPHVVGFCPPDTLIPEVIISNDGSLSQSQEFILNCLISGPVNFQSTAMVVIESGMTETVSFHPFFPELPGDYTVKVYSTLGTDENRSNDTAYSVFSVKHYSFGQGEGNYNFASSNGCFPSVLPVPEFCLKDTSGSVILLKNGTDVSQGLLNGNTEDGYFTLAGFLPEGKKIRFYGVDHDTVNISVNGFLAFGYSELLESNVPPDKDAISSSGASIVAPLWMDYTCSHTDPQNEISYKLSEDQLIVTFSKMQISGDEENNFVTFQLCVSLASASGSNSEILMQYDRTQSGEKAIEMFEEFAESDCFAGIVSGPKLLSFRHKTGENYNDVAQLFSTNLVIEIGPDPEKLSHKCSELNLSLLLEGYRDLSDTISMELRDRYNPERVIESKRFVLPESGNITLPFSIPTEDSRFFIKINHRNSIETWSLDSALSFSDYAMSYDFTLSRSRAFGSNQVMINGRAHIYSGDVNQDGQIDVTDGSAVDNDAYEYRLGFADTDLNGDGIVDSWDKVIVDRNVVNYVFAHTPLTVHNKIFSTGDIGRTFLQK